MANKKRTALDDLLPLPSAPAAKETDAKKSVRARAPKKPQKSREVVEAAPGNNESKDTETQIGKHEIVKQMLYLPLPVAEQLRSLHFEEQRGQAKRVKMHDYFLEAIDLLFKDRGIKSIAELTGKQ